MYQAMSPVFNRSNILKAVGQEDINGPTFITVNTWIINTTMNVSKI